MTQNPARWPEGRAHAAALAIAHAARWSTEPVGMMLDRRYAHYLHANEAQLLLVPSLRPLAAEMPLVDRAMRDARSDALVVSLAAPPGEATLALGLWGLDGNSWLAPMGLWVRGDLGTWLVPDPYHAQVRRECFPLVPGRRLTAAIAPWRSAAEQRQGRTLGRAWMARLLGA